MPFGESADGGFGGSEMGGCQGEAIMCCSDIVLGEVSERAAEVSAWEGDGRRRCE
jgi:hypothetical protein